MSMRSWSTVQLLSNSTVVTRHSPSAAFCLSSMELKPPMVSFSRPCIEPLLSRMKASSVEFFFMVNLLYSRYRSIIWKRRGSEVSLKATNDQPPRSG